jgi:hypothetical protein
MIMTQNADFTSFRFCGSGTIAAMTRMLGTRMLGTRMLGTRMLNTEFATRALLPIAVALGVAGCSSTPDFAQFRAPTFDVSSFQIRDWNAYAKTQGSGRAITSDDLVDGAGRCAAMATPATSDASLEAAAAPPPTSARGVGLDMTECEVVTAAGAPQTVDITTNERGERTVIMTYATADRAGTYRFVSGRLASLERGPEPPAPPPAQKKTAKKKPKQQPST